MLIEDDMNNPADWKHISMLSPPAASSHMTNNKHGTQNTKAILLDAFVDSQVMSTRATRGIYKQTVAETEHKKCRKLQENVD